MNSLVLHSFRRCPFAIRVRMVLEEKELAYNVIEESLSQPSAELLRLHPEGKVPLLIHNGEAIFQSSIITEYLEDTFLMPALLSKKPMDRAQMRLWTYWCDVFFKPDLDLYKYKWEELNDSERESLLLKLTFHFKKLETALEENLFLLGDELSLADIHVFPFYRQIQKSKPDFSEKFSVALLDSWLMRIQARPSFDRVMAKI